MKKTISLLLVFLISFSLTAAPERALGENFVELYHTQDRSTLKNAIKEAIYGAKKSILIITFSFSDPEIISALNKKVLEGIPVTVVIDKDHRGDILSKGSPSIEVVTRFTGEGHLHHKILVVDSKEVWMGSANFTKSAYEGQENLMSRIDSEELADLIEHEANVFRGHLQRDELNPRKLYAIEQDLYFCLLPHDGDGFKQQEKKINQNSKNFLIEKIQDAKQSIKIAMAVFTNNDLLNALKGLKLS